MAVGLLRPSGGEILIDGVDIAATADAAARRAVRRRMQMIFQDPYASLNPRWRVRDIIAEPIFAFGRRGETNRAHSTVMRQVAELMALVGLHEADARKFPHQKHATEPSNRHINIRRCSFEVSHFNFMRMDRQSCITS